MHGAFHNFALDGGLFWQAGLEKFPRFEAIDGSQFIHRFQPYLFFSARLKKLVKREGDSRQISKFLLSEGMTVSKRAQPFRYQRDVV